MHVVTLGFADSPRLTAELFERHGLAAELNVVAAAHLGVSDDAWHRRWSKDDFGLWNELRSRRHHVMPHGHRHANEAELLLAEAQGLIERCLEAFAAQLEGFDPAQPSAPPATELLPLRHRIEAG